jgi:hypothetical protein
MKLKLTRSEFNALYAFFSHRVIGIDKPKNMQGILLFSLLMQVYKQMLKKSVDVKKHYTIKMEDHEAIAFYLFFHRFPMPSELVYERTLILKIINGIYQNYLS